MGRPDWRKYARTRRQIRGAATVAPLPPGLGNYAATPYLHPFRSYVAGAGAAQCSRCFGWRDDPRHWTQLTNAYEILAAE